MALPCPGFEGSEKRLEVDFCFGSGSPPSGLRTLSRRQLDGLLEKVPARLMQAGADGGMSESILCAFLSFHAGGGLEPRKAVSPGICLL